MPDPSYVIETSGRKAGLKFHLDTAFYPPLPDFVKRAMIETFEEYWLNLIPIGNLDWELKERAGYTGGVGNYNFYMFLNEEDFE
jgi:hypothetical protein